jgi:GntR family transcriptional regulator
VDGGGKAGLPDGGKARRVYLLLREEIAGGLHGDRGLLPGEQRLAEMHGVSRVTIRRAMDALEAEGWVESVGPAAAPARWAGRARRRWPPTSPR